MKYRLALWMIMTSIACTGCKSEQVLAKQSKPLVKPATAAEPATRTTAEPMEADASKDAAEPEAVAVAPAPIRIDDGTRTTYQLDPADPIEIVGWWDNGQYLMVVQYDYAYRVLHGEYPDAPVVERGRWTQKNHSRFTLEPYNTSKVESEQVILSKDRGLPIATIEGLPPFHKLPKAPVQVERQLVGNWKNKESSLTLDENGSFQMTHEGSEKRTTGSWRLEQGALVLEPGDPEEDPVVYTLMKPERGRIDSIEDGENPPLLRFVPKPSSNS